MLPKCFNYMVKIDQGKGNIFAFCSFNLHSTFFSGIYCYCSFLFSSTYITNSKKLRYLHEIPTTSNNHTVYSPYDTAKSQFH